MSSWDRRAASCLQSSPATVWSLEVSVYGAHYVPRGLAERPSLISDLTNSSTAIEYLAANLERGALRASSNQAGDWTVLARWQNTGLTAYRAGVPRAVWDKGSRYVARVQEFLPQVSAVLNTPAQPRADTFGSLTRWLASISASRASAIRAQPAMIIVGAQ
jgi:hypothetical protein